MSFFSLVVFFAAYVLRDMHVYVHLLPVIHSSFAPSPLVRAVDSPPLLPFLPAWHARSNCESGSR